MSNGITTAAFKQFSEVGQSAVLQELRIRLLAGKIPGLEKIAFSFKVALAEEKVVKHFQDRGALSPAEAKVIEQTRLIRNKILHCEFDSAIQLIEAQQGSPLVGKGVEVIMLDEKNVLGGLMEAIDSMGSQAPKAKPVSGLAPSDAGIYGTFLDAYQRGAFAAALKLFDEASAIIERLLNI